MLKKDNYFLKLPGATAILLIKIYQRTLSPDYGLLKGFYPHGFCRFYPSCSEYAVQAVQKFGLLKGIAMAVKRIAKCNPWTEPQVHVIKD